MVALFDLQFDDIFFISGWKDAPYCNVVSPSTKYPSKGPPLPHPLKSKLRAIFFTRKDPTQAENNLSLLPV